MLVTLGFIWALGASVYILCGLYAAMTAPPQRHNFFTAWSFAALLFLAVLWPATVWLAVWDALRDDGRGEW